MERSEGARVNKNRFARLSKPEMWRVSTVKLLFALILLFAVTPFVENLPNGDFVESGLITLVMVASLVAVGRDHRVLISAAVLFVPAIAGKWLNHFFPNYVSPLYFPVFGIAFFAFTIYRILRFILQTTHVDTEVLSAGIVVYLMLGLLWAQAYMLLAQLTPDTFHFPLAEHSERHMGGFQCVLFQLQHSYDGRLWGHHAHVQDRAHTGGHGSGYGHLVFGHTYLPACRHGTRPAPAPISPKIHEKR